MSQLNEVIKKATDLLKAKKANVGEVRYRKNGPHQKQADGKWKKVKKGKDGKWVLAAGGGGKGKKKKKKKTVEKKWKPKYNAKKGGQNANSKNKPKGKSSKSTTQKPASKPKRRNTHGVSKQGSRVDDKPGDVNASKAKFETDIGEYQLALEYFGIRSKGGKLSKTNLKKLRKELENLALSKDEFSEQEKELLNLYDGAGGLNEKSTSARSRLTEYYTPKNVVEAAWAAISKYLPTKNAKILEPSSGIGRWIEDHKNNHNVDMIEFEEAPAKIASVLHPEANVKNMSFEELFLADNKRSARPKYEGKKYDAVIGNPPYGKYKSRFKGMGEGKGITTWQEYFINRGLDTLKDGGTLAMVVPSSFLKGGSNVVKSRIGSKAEIVEAYRLPENTFPTTDVSTDLLIFRKGRSGGKDQITDDNYFKENPENVLGEYTRKKDRYGNMVDVVTGDVNDAVSKLKTLTATARYDGPPHPDVKPAIASAIADALIGAFKPVDEGHNPYSPTITEMSEETKRKIAEAMKGNQNAKKNGKKKPEKKKAKKKSEEEEVNPASKRFSDEEVKKATGKTKVPANLTAEEVDDSIEKGEKATEEKIKKNKKKIDKGISDRVKQIMEEAQELGSKKKKKKKKLETKIKEIEERKKGKKVLTQTEFHAKYNAKYNDDELKGFQATDSTGFVDIKKIKFNKETMSVWPIVTTAYEDNEDGSAVQEPTTTVQEKVQMDELYASGPIRDKIRMLEQNKEYMIENYGQAQYDKQLKMLKDKEPEWLSGDRIKIDPASSFVGGSGIKHVFFRWLDMGDHTDDDFITYDGAFGEQILMTPRHVMNHCNGSNISKHELPISNDMSAKDKREIREKYINARKAVAENIFRKFLSDNGRLRNGTTQAAEINDFVEKFNDKFNSWVEPDYSKVPVMGEGISEDFKGGEFKLHDIQLEGAARLTTKGSGVLAYEVGCGKTLSGALATISNMKMGRCKRPFIAVPKSTYDKWATELKDAFPDVNFNYWGNMTKVESGQKPDENSVTLITHDAMPIISFTDETISDLSEDVYDTLKDPTKTLGTDDGAEEAGEDFAGKAAKVRASSKTVHYAEQLGIDHITIDEMHNFKNVFSAAKKKEDSQINEYSSIKGSTSDRAVKMYYLTRYLQKNYKGNVYGLTATPFTNSPIEIYNALSMVAHSRMKELGINNLHEFMQRYISLTRELAVSSTQQMKQKTVVKGFNNLRGLQNLIKEYFDFRTSEDAGVNPPKKTVHKHELKPTELQREIFDELSKLVGRQSKKDPSAEIEAINHMRVATLSPASVSLVRTRRYEDPYGNTVEQTENLFSKDLEEKIKKIRKENIIKHSPKLKFTFDTIGKSLKSKPELGHFVYMPMGVNQYPDIKKYMQEEHGVDPSEIAFVKGGENKDKIEDLKTKFNNPAHPLKIIVGSATAKEGIDLNGNTTAIYNTFLDWNPTDAIQVEGRGVRQGNHQENVNVAYPVLADSVDSLMYQKFDEKQSRISNIWSYTGDVFDIDTINPEEIKTALIKDPEIRAETLQNRMLAQVDDRSRELKAIAGKIESNINIVKNHDQHIATLEASAKTEYENYYKKSETKLKEAKENLAKVKKDKESDQSDITTAEWQLRNAKTEHDRNKEDYETYKKRIRNQNKIYKEASEQLSNYGGLDGAKKEYDRVLAERRNAQQKKAKIATRKHRLAKWADRQIKREEAKIGKIASLSQQVDGLHKHIIDNSNEWTNKYDKDIQKSYITNNGKRVLLLKSKKGKKPGSGNKKILILKKGSDMPLMTGPRGGKYYLVNGKKIYSKKVAERMKEKKYKNKTAQSVHNAIRNMTEEHQAGNAIFKVSDLFEKGKINEKEMQSLYQDAETALKELRNSHKEVKDFAGKVRKKKVMTERKAKEGRRKGAINKGNERKQKAVKQKAQRIKNIHKRLDNAASDADRLIKEAKDNMKKYQPIAQKLVDRNKQLVAALEATPETSPKYSKMKQAHKQTREQIGKIMTYAKKMKQQVDTMKDRKAKIEKVRQRADKIDSESVEAKSG